MSSEIQKILDKVIELGFREDAAIAFIRVSINKLEQELGGKPVFTLTKDEKFMIKHNDLLEKQ